MSHKMLSEEKELIKICLFAVLFCCCVLGAYCQCINRATDDVPCNFRHLATQLFSSHKWDEVTSNKQIAVEFRNEMEMSSRVWSQMVSGFYTWLLGLLRGENGEI